MVTRQPSKKLYRTMQGRLVDIEKLRATNEEVRAVGNMSVNARGDVIGSGGKIIKTKDPDPIQAKGLDLKVYENYGKENIDYSEGYTKGNNDRMSGAQERYRYVSDVDWANWPHPRG